jgi:hypothetical protein
VQKVENGMFVSVSYTGTLDNGDMFDSSEGRHPLEFQTGAEQLIKGFEDAVMGGLQFWLRLQFGWRSLIRITGFPVTLTWQYNSRRASASRRKCSGGRETNLPPVARNVLKKIFDSPLLLSQNSPCAAPI